MSRKLSGSYGGGIYISRISSYFNGTGDTSNQSANQNPTEEKQNSSEANLTNEIETSVEQNTSHMTSTNNEPTVENETDLIARRITKNTSFNTNEYPVTESKNEELEEQMTTRDSMMNSDPPKVTANAGPASSYDDFKLMATGTQARQYDYWARRPNVTSSYQKFGFIDSVADLIVNCLGGGIVMIHEGYADCGLWSALYVTIILGFLTAYIMFTLVKNAQKVYGRVQRSSLTFSEVAEATFMISPFKSLRKHGKTIKCSVDILIVIDLFGACCCYQVIFAKSFISLTEDIIGKEKAPDIRIVILCLLIPCIVISFIISYKYFFKYLGVISIITTIVVVLTVGSCVYFAVQRRSTIYYEFPVLRGFTELMKFLGICLFSVEGVAAILPIENNMRNPRKMAWVVAIGMSVVLGIATVAGFFGCWGFGPQDRGDNPVTNLFPKNVYSMTLKITMMVLMYINFAIHFWISFDIAWKYQQWKYRYNPHIAQASHRVIFVLVITLVSIMLPNITNFMGLIGAVCLSLTGFVFPAVIELLLDWTDPGLGFMKWRLMKCIILSVLGFTIFLFSSFYNAKELFQTTFHI